MKWSPKEKMERLGRANEEARQEEIRRWTPERAERILEALLSTPWPIPPTSPEDHPVSLSRRVHSSHA